MKKVGLFLLVAIWATCAVGTFAQSTIGNTSAAANLIMPITLTQTSSLNFGSLSVLAGQNGTCTLSTAGVRSTTGSVTLVSASTVTNAAYNVSGAASVAYQITLPSTITVTSGSNTLTISALKAHPASAGADQTTGTLSGSGTDNFTVGGTLTIPTSHVDGLYSGTFAVTVAYN